MIRKASIVAVLLFIGACSWAKSNSTLLSGDAAQVAACIATQALGGAADPASIATACAPATIADVEQIVGSLLTYYGSQNAPKAMFNETTLDRLHDLHERALKELGDAHGS